MNPDLTWKQALTPAKVFAYLTTVAIGVGGWLLTQPKHESLGWLVLTLAGGGNIGGSIAAHVSGLNKGFAQGSGATPIPVDKPNAPTP